eukprot:812905-Amphidinium_carterae.1
MEKKLGVQDAQILEVQIANLYKMTANQLEYSLPKVLLNIGNTRMRLGRAFDPLTYYKNAATG